MSNELNNDLIERIEILLKSGVGDTGRLEYIRDSIKKGKQLFSSDQKYLESILSMKTIQNKIKVEQDEKINHSYTNTVSKFCGKCGTSVSDMNNFCTNCGFPTQNTSNPQKLGSVQSDPTHDTIQPRNTTKSHNFNKFMMGLSILLFIGAVYTSSVINGTMAVILFIISYVSLKNKSKTVTEIILIASFLLVIISIFNVVRH